MVKSGQLKIMSKFYVPFRFNFGQLHKKQKMKFGVARRLDSKERHHRNLQRTHWYTMTGQTHTLPSGC